MTETIIARQRNGYLISTDRSLLNIDAIQDYLSNSYWSTGLPMNVLERAISGSVCFGVYLEANQVGFARVITDRATFAYLCDVYVLAEHQGQGLGKWLMEEIANHPDLQGLRRFVLVTRDAHGLYERFGFKPLAKPDGYMEIHRPNIYSEPEFGAGSRRSQPET